MSGGVSRRRGIGSAVGIVLCLWSVDARAQGDGRDVATKSQLLMLQRVFVGLSEAPPSKQLFNLYFAEVLLSAAPSGLDALGWEEAVTSGALTVAKSLETSRDAEVARQARAVRARLEALLAEQAAADAPALDLDTDEERSVESQANGAAQWVKLQLRRGFEYRFEASDCPMLRVLAVAQEGGRPIAGGTVFKESFLFVASEDRAVRVRVQTPLCAAGNDVTISALPEAIRVTDASESAPQIVKEGVRFRGTLAGGDSAQWFRLDAAGVSRRYVVTADPLTSELDPKITVYDPHTQAEIDSNDDGPEGLGSRLEVRSSAATHGLVIKVEQIGDYRGDYDLTVRGAAPVGAGARPLILGAHDRGQLDKEGSNTWAVQFAAGRRYDISTEPLSNGLDTKVTLYDADENEVSSNDDSGINLGSRLQYTSAETATYFLRVEAIESTSGEYGIAMKEGPPVSEIARRAVMGENKGSLTDSEDWWVIELAAGLSLEFETIPGNGQLDTVLELYADDTVTMLAEDDDGGTGYGSKLTHDAEKAGRLYIRVRRYDSSTGEYKLVLRNAP
jgi:hypothetical protein